MGDKGDNGDNDSDGTDPDDSDNYNDNENNQSSKRPFQAISSNVLLVRAELTDFWRCTSQTNWEISQHHILYPNPYPKKNRIKKRFYAHPSFPIILSLGGEITIRSNWEGYLKEFAQSVIYANEYYEEGMAEGDADADTKRLENIALPYYENAVKGPKERVDKTIAWTNFEKKYDDVGEKTYELIL
jgi:tRNA G46 methylase TrmB